MTTNEHSGKLRGILTEYLGLALVLAVLVGVTVFLIYNANGREIDVGDAEARGGIHGGPPRTERAADARERGG